MTTRKRRRSYVPYRDDRVHEAIGLLAQRRPGMARLLRQKRYWEIDYCEGGIIILAPPEWIPCLRLFHSDILWAFSVAYNHSYLQLAILSPALAPPTPLPRMKVPPLVIPNRG